jgi:hypothetical protein
MTLCENLNIAGRLYLAISFSYILNSGRRGRDRIVVQLPVQSAYITTEVASSNRVHCEVYSIQHYVIKFVSDLRQVGGFLRVFH